MKASPKLIASVRWLLLVTAGFATLIAGFVVEENIRGNRAWRRLEAEYAARHEPLRFEEFTAPPVADSQNLFKAPIWAKLISESTPAPELAQAEKAVGLEQLNVVHALKVTPLDFHDARAEMVRQGLVTTDNPDPDAEAVLSGMRPVAALLDGVRAAVRERPTAAITLQGGLHPSDLRVGNVWSIAKLLVARARTEIAAKKPAEAYEDTLTILRIARACETRPVTLLQTLVAAALAVEAGETAKLARANHAWTDEQLAALQQAFTDLRLVPVYQASLRTERAWIINILDQLPHLSAAEKKQIKWPRWIIPGWVQQNKVAVCRSWEPFIDCLASFGTADYPRRLRALEAEDKQVRDHRSPYTYVARLAHSRTREIMLNFTKQVDELRAAETALALERFYVKHGRYPRSLDELTPSFVAALPLQSDGTPVAYRPTDDGTAFALDLSPQSSVPNEVTASRR